MSLPGSSKINAETAPQDTAPGARKTIKAAKRLQSTEVVTPPCRTPPVNAGVHLGTGTKPLVDWASISPWWIADFMPNFEAEMGMLVMCIAMVPLCWNAVKQHSAQ